MVLVTQSAVVTSNFLISSTEKTADCESEKCVQIIISNLKIKSLKTKSSSYCQVVVLYKSIQKVNSQFCKP